MEKLYRKKENGRYEEVGYGPIPDISDGIWLVQSKPNSRRISSLVWKVGDLKRPVDVTTHAAIQTLEDELIDYLNKLHDEESAEHIEATLICGGYLKGPIHVTNISPSDFMSLILRRIAIGLEEKKK